MAVRVSLEYPNFMGSSWVVSPSLFYRRDLHGFSMDSQIVEGRQTINPGLNFNLNKAHNIRIDYTTFADGAKYDPFHDRDNASISYSYTF
jgi:hypothetical protein